MGASASTNVSKIRNDITSQAYQSCPGSNVSNTAVLNGVKYTMPQWCPAGSPGFDIDQTASIDATCFLGSLQSSIAESTAKLSAQAQAGLGLSASTDKSTVENQLKSQIDQKCAGYSTSNAAQLNDVTVDACQFRLVQNASQNLACQINASQQTADSVATSLASEAKGGSLFGDLFGGFGGIGKWIIIIVVILAVLGLIGGIIAAVVKSKGKKGDATTAKGTKTTTKTNAGTKATTTTGTTTTTKLKQDGGENEGFFETFKNNKSLMVLVILLLIIIVVILFNTYAHNKPPINEQDLETLQQTITDAKNIAKVQYSAPTTPDYTYSPVQDEIIGNEIYYNMQYDDSAFNIDNTPLDDYYKPLLEQNN